MPTDKPDTEAEARRILERVTAETDVSAGIVTSQTRPAKPVDNEDWIERVGTRIGRGASIVLFLGLLIWLAVSLFGPGATP